MRANVREGKCGLGARQVRNVHPTRHRRRSGADQSRLFHRGEEPYLHALGVAGSFLFSAVLIVIALYVRLKISETPVFTEQKERRAAPKAPIAKLLGVQARQIVLASGCVVGHFALSFMVTTYLVNYALSQLGHPVASCSSSGCSAVCR